MLVLADNMSHMASVYRQLVRSGRWCERADAAAALFRQRFRPVDIFGRARIYRDLGLVPRREGPLRRYAQGRSVRGRSEHEPPALSVRQKTISTTSVEAQKLACDAFDHGSLHRLCNELRGRAKVQK